MAITARVQDPQRDLAAFGMHGVGQRPVIAQTRKAQVELGE